MMRSQCSVLVILWLGALFCDVSTFTIRRRENSDADLSQAVRLLERQRRRINEFDYLAGSRLPEPDPQLIPPELAQWGQDIPSREEEEWLDTPYRTYDEGSYPEEFAKEYVERPVSEKDEPSKEELEDIFDESPTEIQKKSTDEGDAESFEQVAKEAEHAESKDDELDDLTEDEFKALMSAVEKLQKKALAKKDTSDMDDVSAGGGSEEVSTAELKEVFDDSDDDEDVNKTTEEESDESVVPSEAMNPSVDEADEEAGSNDLGDRDKETLSSIRKYWMLGNMLQGSDKRRKRFTKRAPVQKAPTTIPLEETYRQEIDQLREEIQQLKLITQIEDMENDALTQTLNEATLSQMEGSVSEKEFQSLESAINLEEALQDLRNGRVNPLIVELLAADAVGDLDKRGEPLWRKKEKRMDDTDLEESYPMFSNDKRAVKKEKEYPPWAQGRAEEDFDLDTAKRQKYRATQNAIEELVNDLEGPNVSEEIDEEDDSEAGGLLSPMPSSYTKGDDTALDLFGKASYSGQCPSVSLLTDCRFADLQGLPIDNEARELCNRHEMCYECGATAGIKQGECDNLYRGQAAVLCNQDPECVVEAELFLKELKLKHRYTTFYEPVCDNSCTEDYIGL